MDIVNVLIYPEPIVFLEQVEKNMNFANVSLEKLIRPLSAVKNRKYKFWIVCNEFHKIDEFIRHNVQVIIVSQRELTDNWKYNPIQLQEQWNSGEYNDIVLNYYCELFKKKVNFKPDIIFSFIFREVFLEKLFNNTLFFCYNPGIIKNSPYPHTASYAIGDFGRMFDSYVSEYWDQIKAQHKLTEYNKKLLYEFKTKSRSLIQRKNPFIDIIKQYKKDFKYLYLLPLTIPYNMLLPKQKTYHSEFHLLLDVLDNTPENVGIIVTTHPLYMDYLDEKMIVSLKKKYKHFLNDPSFKKYLCSSQFLLPEIDGVIGLTSSVGIQSLLFDKKIISLGETYLDCIRDASSFAEFSMKLDHPATNKDDLLFWYLTRYCFTQKYYLNSEWLDNFIMRSLEKYNNNDFTNFYELIDEPSVVINHLIESLDENIPYRANIISDTDKYCINNLRTVPVECNREFLFGSNSWDNIYLIRGFHLPGKGHVCTKQKVAEIEFPIPLIKTDLKLTIRGKKIYTEQSAELMINDRIYGEIKDDVKNEFIIKSEELIKITLLNIKLIVSNVYIPKDLGINNDIRELGYALFGIGLYECK